MIRNCSAILLFDDKKRILIQHRTEDAPTLPGYWGFFGGGIEEGETPEMAVRRETYEELEYKLVNPKLIMTKKFRISDITGTDFVFMEEYNPKKKLVLREGQGKEWFNIEEVKHLKMCANDRKVLQCIKGKY